MEIYILIAIVILGVGVFWYLSNQSGDESEHQPSQPVKNNYNQKSEYSGLMAPQKAKSSVELTEHRKIEGELTSDAVTLIAKSSWGRDEFFGWVDIIDGHHIEPSPTRDYEKIQSWQYLGDGDRYDSTQRAKDFKQLKTLFKQKVDEIISTMSSDNWTTELSSEEEKTEIYLLSRNKD